METQTKPSRYKTPEAARRAAEAGARNLAEWKRRVKVPSGYKHGAFSVLGGGKLPLGRREIIRAVDDTVREIEIELGGPEKITARQRTIVSSIRSLSLVLFLGCDYIVKHGIVNERGEPYRILETMNAACNTLLRYVHILEPRRGSGGKRAPQSLEDVLREYAGGENLDSPDE